MIVFDKRGWSMATIPLSAVPERATISAQAQTTRFESILHQAQKTKKTNLVTQHLAKQYGSRNEGVNIGWFNGPSDHDLRAVRDAVRALVQERA